MHKPVVGITTDVDQYDERCFVRPGYARSVARAGGTPVILSTAVDLIPDYLDLCDAFIFTGGDDPIMEDWSIETHHSATTVHPGRQVFELTLLSAIETRPSVPVLGICLGMQYMALHAGGRIDQFLPETSSEIAARHWGKVEHEVECQLRHASQSTRHSVLSHHRQAITDAGALVVCGRSVAEGVIEAICNPDRYFYLGVQWHPEQTVDNALGGGLFRDLLAACTAGTRI